MRSADPRSSLRGALVLGSATSVAPTLQRGDVFLAEPLDASRPLARGDVVVYGRGGGTVFVRRVVGLPGERVAVHTGLLRIDGATVLREATGRRVRIGEAPPGAPDVPPRTTAGRRDVVQTS